MAHPECALLTVDALDPHAEDGAHAVAPVQIDEPRTDLRIEHPAHRHRQRIDQRDLTAQQSSGRGDLGADETRTNHDHGPTGQQVSAQSARVHHCPQDVHPGPGFPR